jgi:hypothetical protein
MITANSSTFFGRRLAVNILTVAVIIPIQMTSAVGDTFTNVDKIDRAEYKSAADVTGKSFPSFGHLEKAIPAISLEDSASQNQEKELDKLIAKDIGVTTSEPQRKLNPAPGNLFKPTSKEEEEKKDREFREFRRKWLKDSERRWEKYHKRERRRRNKMMRNIREAERRAREYSRKKKEAERRRKEAESKQKAKDLINLGARAFIEVLRNQPSGNSNPGGAGGGKGCVNSYGQKMC